MKILSSINLTNKKFGLVRPAIKQYSGLTNIIGNFRKLLHSLGYDSSLLNDQEILAFEDLIYMYEQGDEESLIEVLEFLL